ncbi:hypothetical protein PVAND_015121 [Polypedilum vanderplanki]|uniref:Uncharacterized protein n=1 Tax=Polypedilum vanderplanki TaxID=319348 RepID=A0A9J6BBP7_POLVA|nr:hypothetical protein PVAND_015121 [Polypedilum vanderplanki]
MNPFLEKINENRTIIVLKPSEFDESLYYVYMYLRQKYSRTARMITFYFNFNDFAYSKLFEEMHSQTESDFLDQLFKLTGAESEFERFLFERNYKSGGIFWIMDNVEYLQAGPTLNQEIIQSVLLKFIKEIRFNSLGLQIEKNWQFVVSNLANVMNRVDELQSPVYSVEKREGPVDYDMMIAMREIGSNRNIIISIKKFPI